MSEATGGPEERHASLGTSRSGSVRTASAAMIRSADANGGLTFSTVADTAALEALAADWDRLVVAMRRPSPFLLHGWACAWWRHFGRAGELAVEVARRDGRVVAALPVFVRSSAGVRVARFLGGHESALGDLLLAPGEDPATAASLASRLAHGPSDLADLYGLPGESRLAAALPPSTLRLIRRSDAPVLDLSAGWESVYVARTPAKTRSLHRRRWRQLRELGGVEVVLARSAGELRSALEEAFALHALRWEGRPDLSTFGTEPGMAFHRDALAAAARDEVARILTLRLDGRAVAFHYYFVLASRMYVHRLAFDPSLARVSPGLLCTLESLRLAAEEGVTRVEFLGGAERYKIELADRMEPLYQGLGLASSVRGRAVVAARWASLELRHALKRSKLVRRAYYEGAAVPRALLARLRGRPSGSAREV